MAGSSAKARLSKPDALAGTSAGNCRAASSASQCISLPRGPSEGTRCCFFS